jgi:S1-C subfamily serine protease
VESGSFAVTTSGELAGLIVAAAGEHILVGPLRNQPTRDPGDLGLEVEPLTPRLASATGSTGGVVVTWVAERSAATGELVPGDVIEEADGRGMTAAEWTVRATRLAVGETVTLRVRRAGEMREVVLVAAPRSSPADAAFLGLTMRALPGVGSEVLRVQSSTAAARAGVVPGDVITRAGEAAAPTPREVRAAYAADREQRGVLLALTRGTAHRVVALAP